MKLGIVLITIVLLTGCTTQTNEPMVINPTIQSVYEDVMYEGVQGKEYYLIWENGFFGLIDKNGIIIIEPIYGEIYLTNSSDYLVKKENHYYLYRNGQLDEQFSNVLIAMESNYDDYKYDETIGLWKVQKDNSEFYIDFYGNPIGKEKLRMVESLSVVFSANAAASTLTYAKNLFIGFSNEENKYGCAIYNLNGEEIVSFSIEEEDFENRNCVTAEFEFQNSLEEVALYKPKPLYRLTLSFLAIKSEEYWDVYNLTGEKIVEKVGNLNPVNENDFCIFQYDKSQQSFCLGQDEIIYTGYTWMTDDGMFFTKRDGYYGSINESGETIIEFIYDELYELPIDVHYEVTDIKYFHARKGDQSFVLNREGKILFEHSYLFVMKTGNPDILFGYDEQFGYFALDLKGNKLIRKSFSEPYAGNHFFFGFPPEESNQSEYYYTEVYNSKLEKIYGSSEGYPTIELDGVYAVIAKRIDGGDYYRYVINESGKEVGEYIGNIGIAMIYKKDDTLYIDNGEKKVIIDKFLLSTYDIQDKKTGFIQLGEEIYFIDEKLDIQYSFEADNVFSIGSIVLENNKRVSYYKVEKDGKLAIMLESGEILTDFIFDDILEINAYGFITVEKDGEFAAINYRGEIATEYMELSKSSLEENNFVIADWTWTNLYNYYSLLIKIQP